MPPPRPLLRLVRPSGEERRRCFVSLFGQRGQVGFVLWRAEDGRLADDAAQDQRAAHSHPAFPAVVAVRPASEWVFDPVRLADGAEPTEVPLAVFADRLCLQLALQPVAVTAFAGLVRVAEGGCAGLVGLLVRRLYYGLGRGCLGREIGSRVLVAEGVCHYDFRLRLRLRLRLRNFGLCVRSE